MNHSHHSGPQSKPMQAHIVAQWITSLAISVICCAVLFVVFASYIVELNETHNLMVVKVEAMQEKISLMHNEMSVLKRQPLVQINTTTPPVVSATPDANLQDQPAPPPVPDSVLLSEPSGGPVSLDGKDELMTTATPPTAVPPMPEPQKVAPPEPPKPVPPPEKTPAKPVGKEPKKP